MASSRNKLARSGVGGRLEELEGAARDDVTLRVSGVPGRCMAEIALDTLQLDVDGYFGRRSGGLPANTGVPVSN